MIGLKFNLKFELGLKYSANRCSDCLDTDNVCGWCVVNKECSGTAQGGTNISNFY